jgi:lipid A ethanolaminephosphotransferase
MDNYNISIDDSMIKNLLNSNFSDLINILSAEMVVYIVLLGILPSVVVYKTELVHRSFKNELFNAIKLISMSLATIIVVIVLLGDFYTTFFREHAELRSYTNPTTFIYSSVKYFSQNSITTTTSSE